jgi:RIO kinase 2
MRLDVTDLRYITSEQFRVLTAVRRGQTAPSQPASNSADVQVEMGSKNHEVVPTPLIAQISGLRSGGANKCIGELAKRNLIAKVQNAKCAWYVWIRYVHWEPMLIC